MSQLTTLILTRRECWTLTWKARIVGLLGLATLAWLAVWRAEPFLAVDRPVSGQLLVIEGWTPPYTVHQAAAIFRERNYRRILVVRAPYEVSGLPDSHPFYGDYVAPLLKRYGVPETAVESLLCPVSKRDRTYHSAMMVRDWLARQVEPTSTMDVATLGVHARRSRLMYQKALGNMTKVGVIALEDSAYDRHHWWRSSEGVRESLGEGIAYFYARLFFRPAQAASLVGSRPNL